MMFLIKLFNTLNIKMLMILMSHCDAENDEIYNNSNDEKY
jgi:hypothetical protein